MLVKNCMTRHPVMIEPNMLLHDARQVMVENEIGYLPVVDSGKKLEGLITRSHFSMSLDQMDSLDVWEISSKLIDLKVKNVMIKKRQVITVSSDATVEQAARLLTQHDISCLPVVDDSKVVGMITTIDLLRSYQEMLGMPTAGIRVTVRMLAKKQSFSELAKLMTVIGEQEWGVIGIGTFPAPQKPDYYDAVVKIPGVTLEEVRDVLEKIPGQTIVDIREAGLQ
ncbi:MAG TPA: CBS domain-containing protein [Anaerolineaceae bacterium]|nr:CBS domain-containing protein [Anaerolineaceae bacterium]